MAADPSSRTKVSIFMLIFRVPPVCLRRRVQRFDDQQARRAVHLMHEAHQVGVGAFVVGGDAHHAERVGAFDGLGRVGVFLGLDLGVDRRRRPVPRAASNKRCGAPGNIRSGIVRLRRGPVRRRPRAGGCWSSSARLAAVCACSAASCRSKFVGRAAGRIQHDPGRADGRKQQHAAARCATEP